MKIAFAVVAFAAVGLGSYKTYCSYTAANMSEEDLLMAENVLALSEGSYSCSASANCYNGSKLDGTVSCSGTNQCISGVEYVECDGKKSYCYGSQE